MILKDESDRCLCLLLQIAAAQHLREEVKKGVQGRAKLGVEAFAEALLGVPKILAENCGYDPQVGYDFLVGVIPCREKALYWLYKNIQTWRILC